MGLVGERLGCKGRANLGDVGLDPFANLVPQDETKSSAKGVRAHRRE